MTSETVPLLVDLFLLGVDLETDEVDLILVLELPECLNPSPRLKQALKHPPRVHTRNDDREHYQVERDSSVNKSHQSRVQASDLFHNAKDSISLEVPALGNDDGGADADERGAIEVDETG